MKNFDPVAYQKEIDRNGVLLFFSCVLLAFGYYSFFTDMDLGDALLASLFMGTIASIFLVLLGLFILCFVIIPVMNLLEFIADISVAIRGWFQAIHKALRHQVPLDR